MKKSENIDLIKGKFTPADAKEIIVTLITNKINFHQMKNFSLEERFGKPDKRSEKRIRELKTGLDKISALIEAASKNNYHLNIGSSIKIKMEK